MTVPFLLYDPVQCVHCGDETRTWIWDYQGQACCLDCWLELRDKPKDDNKQQGAA